MISKVRNYKELKQALDDLNVRKIKQEALLKKNTQEIKAALDPINMAKNYLKRIASDNELHADILKAAVGIGSTFIIEKVLGKKKGALRQFASTVIERVFTE